MLSPAEIRVLAAMPDNSFKYKQVAQHLHLSHHTVKRHMMATFIKLKVDNKYDAHRTATELGLL